MKKFFEGFFDDFSTKLIVGAFVTLVIYFIGFLLYKAFTESFLVSTITSVFLLVSYLVGHIIASKS
jgi:putative effector of murein hydrolase